MMAINGRIQREGDVVHLVAQQLFDLSGNLLSLADRDIEFPLTTSRGDEFAHGSTGSLDLRDRAAAAKARDIFIPDLHIDTLISFRGIRRCISVRLRRELAMSCHAPNCRPPHQRTRHPSGRRERSGYLSRLPLASGSLVEPVCML